MRTVASLLMHRDENMEPCAARTRAAQGTGSVVLRRTQGQTRLQAERTAFGPLRKPLPTPFVVGRSPLSSTIQSWSLITLASSMRPWRLPSQLTHIVMRRPYHSRSNPLDIVEPAADLTSVRHTSPLSCRARQLIHPDTSGLSPPPGPLTTCNCSCV